MKVHDPSLNRQNRATGSNPIGIALLAVVLWIAAGAAYFGTTPRFHGGRIEIDGQESREVSMPFAWYHKDPRGSAPVGLLRLHYQVDLPRWHSSWYRLHVDDKLVSLTLNGHPVELGKKEVGWRNSGRTFHVGPFLKTGPNVLEAVILNKSSAGLWIDAAARDPWRMAAMALALTALTATAFLIGAHLPLGKWQRVAAIVFLAGALLRGVYCANTAPFERCYDYNGHLFYLEYVLQRGEIPPRNLGWETFQPPLYYVGSVGLAQALLFLDGNRLQVFQIWQMEALAISLAVLALGIWIARCCFPLEQDHRARTRLLLGLALFPSVVFYASRISNDVLFSLCSFVWLLGLLRFWEKASARWLGLTALSLGLGLISKSSALLLIPSSLLVLALQPARTWVWKLRMGLFAAGIVLLIAGPFQIRNAIEARNTSNFVVGNIESLPDDLRIPGTVQNFVTFNPIQVACHPVSKTTANDPRRGMVPEFYFRSAFFGEFGPSGTRGIASVMIVLALLLLPFVMFGIWQALRCRQGADVPLLLALGMIVAGQLAYVWRQPFCCNSDFRFFIVAAVPWLYFFNRGLQTSRPRLAIAGEWLFRAEAVAVVVFLLRACVG